jgi:predicted signal transduction protein with EAL and GGDEF domain
VVAEGVEDERSWRILQDLECDLVQGYFLARPMPAEQMTAWLRDRMSSFATRLHAGPAASATSEDDEERPEPAPTRQAGSRH